MIIAGASRHAKEIIQIIETDYKNLIFFDDYSQKINNFFTNWIVAKSTDELKNRNETNFILALGGAKSRFIVAQKLMNAGFVMKSIVAKTAIIGNINMNLSEGLNIMHFSFVGNSVVIGKGTLINTYVSIHHDAVIGEFCDLSPRSTILGGASVGNFTSIGSAAVILPDIKVGNNCVIGAGAIVINDIPDNSVAVGNPARVIKSQ